MPVTWYPIISTGGRRLLPAVVQVENILILVMTSDVRGHRTQTVNRLAVK